MASEPNPKVAGGRTPGGRTTPVLVPQAALAGQPDIPLDRPVTTVGSNDNARLHLVSRTVSKGHAIFVNSGGVTYVADLASRTGVIVNGKLIKDLDLKTGDRVQIGKFVFRYRSPANLAPPPPAVMPPAAAVIVVGSPAKSVDGRVFQIGRKENCDISFPLDAAVSAGHAVIFEMDGRWYLRDLGSRTGTVVNGKPIHQQVLNFGDRIVIGSSTILFQPGAARVEEFDDSDIESDVLSETAELPAEVDREEAVVPTPPAAVDDDAIPLADDFPASAVDWKSAFRGTDPDQEAAAAELERNIDPIPAEPDSVAHVDAIELPPISIDDALQPASIDAEPIDEVPIAIEPEPVAMESDLIEVESKIQPVAIQPEPIAIEETVEPFAIEPEPIAIEETVEPVAIEPEPIAIEETIEPVAIEPEPIAIEETVEPVAIEPEPIAIEEPDEPVAIEPEPIAIEETVEPVAIEPGPIAIEKTLEPVAAEPEPIKVDETVEPVLVEPEPIANEEAVESIATAPAPADVVQTAKPVAIEPEPIGDEEEHEPIAIESEPIVAKESNPATPLATPIGDLVEPVEDFVFVPVDEKADPNAVPDLIFWGDAELDSATEQAVVSPPVPKSSPLADAAITAEMPAAPADEVTIPETAIESVQLTPVTELIPVTDFEAADKNSVEPESPAPIAADIFDDAPVTRPDIQPDVAVDLASDIPAENLEEAAPVTEIEPVDEIPVDIPVDAELPESVATDPVDEATVAPPLIVEEVAHEPSVVPVVDPGEEIVTPAEADFVADISAEPALDAASVDTASEEPAPEIVADHVDEIISPVDLETSSEDLIEANHDAVLPETDIESTANPDIVAPLDDANAADSAGIFDEPAAETPVDAEPTPVALTVASPPDLTADDGDAAAPAPDDELAPAPDPAGEILSSIEVEPAEPVAESGEHAAEITPSAELDIDGVSAESTLNIDPPGLVEDAEPEYELVTDAEVEQEISIIGDSVDSTNDSVIDPLADSFPLVQADEDVAVPQDLHAFSAASAAMADIYGRESSAPESAAEPPAGDLSSIPIAEEISADPEPIGKFIDVASDPAPTPEPTAIAVETPVEESFDLDDLEFLEPGSQTITQTATPTDFSGISTVDEISADDEGEHASGFEEVETEHEALAVEETPAPVEALPEMPEVSVTTDQIDQVDQPIDIAATSTVEEIPTGENFTLTEDSAPPIAEPESNESDLEFLDESPRATETPEPPTPAPPQAPAVTGGPSIFGIQFEGGSFLGGMPISLREKPPTVVPPASPSPVFDARSVKPTGLDGMLAAPAPITPATPAITAPRPAAIQPVAPTPTSLSGLVSDAHLPWAVPPVIPPTARPATPPARPGLVKKALTSNFAAAPGEKPRVAEVFSQMSAPIGVEVFGGRPGDPNQFNVPETKKTDPENQDLVTEPPRVTSLPPVKKPRRSLLLLWLMLALLVPLAILGAFYKFWPVNYEVIGSLSFDGLATSQSVDDAHTFRDVTEPNLIRSNEVREIAQDILLHKGLPDGFTHDPTSYDKVFDSEFLNWDQQRTFQFTYNTTNYYLGHEQVDAVMTALLQKNQDLNVAKYHATVNERAAKRALDEATAKNAALGLKRHQLKAEAEDYPDAMIVAQADQDASLLNQQWTDAKTLRANNEKVLADLKNEDPTKVIDIEADPQVMDLKNQLQPILDQIAKLKGAGSVDSGSKTVIGTNVSVGATTQPDDNIDPLINPLQQRADVLSKKLDQRRSELAAEIALGPEQRAVNISREIDDLSVKITNLKRTEADAEVAAKQATAKATDLHAKVTQARLAEAQAQDLETQLAEAQAEQRQRRIDQEKQEAILAGCITPIGSPSVKKGNVTDMRIKLGASCAVTAFLFFGVLAVGEYRRPKIIAGVAPAAAPLANPPVRLIPWPQPREVNGSGEQHQPVVEPEQMLGV
jgi:pSer/pThr/pTyr-binding forkhead associated (FHA) protein